MDSQLFSTFFSPSLKRGNINTRPKSFIKKSKWWERGTAATEDGGRGLLVGYTFLSVFVFFDFFILALEIPD